MKKSGATIPNAHTRATALLVLAATLLLACGDDAVSDGDWDIDDELDTPTVTSAWAYHIPTGAARTGINIELAEPEVCVVFLIVGSIEPGLTFDVTHLTEDWQPPSVPPPSLVEGTCDGVFALTDFPESSTRPIAAEGQVVTRGGADREHAEFFDVDIRLEFEVGNGEFPPRELSVQVENIEFSPR